jgi:hypothetical protein
VVCVEEVLEGFLEEEDVLGFDGTVLQGRSSQRVRHSKS